MNRRQFLLTKKDDIFPHLAKTQKIGDYFLYLGKDSEYCFVKNETTELHLLGCVYDWEFPELSNEQILEKIAQNGTLDKIIRGTEKYFGQFVLIIKLLDQIYIMPDAAAQKEVFYDNDFYAFATQPKLIGLVTELHDYTDNDSKEFFNSNYFKEQKLFILNRTHKSNIFHLLPNHLLHINQKRAYRFFPAEAIQRNPIEYVAKKSAEMLKGYISAISKRDKIKMGVTGGYDSRVLFLASLDTDCAYFVSKQSFMDETFHDLTVPKFLSKHFDREIVFEDYEKDTIDMQNAEYLHDVDFPNFEQPIYKNAKNYVFINGNVSEIARNYYGYFQSVTLTDCCKLFGTPQMNYTKKLYQEWLQNRPLFRKFGYHELDLLYWEGRMGIWAAKSKTDNYALGIDLLSPFNSKGLLKLLLSTHRKYRDLYFNRLYDLILSELSGHDQELLKLPINESRKIRVIKTMQTLRIFKLYRYIRIKM